MLSAKRKDKSVKGTRKAPSSIVAESISRQSASQLFTNSGRMMAPIQRVNVDFAAPLLQELDQTAKELNISRQAVIKTLLRQALDQHYLANAGRTTEKHR